MRVSKLNWHINVICGCLVSGDTCQAVSAAHEAFFFIRMTSLESLHTGGYLLRASQTN